MKPDHIKVEQLAALKFIESLHRKYCKFDTDKKYLASCTRHFIERLTVDRFSEKVNPNEFCKTLSKIYQTRLCEYLYVLERLLQDNCTGFVRVVDNNLTLFISKRHGFPFALTTVLEKEAKKSYTDGVVVLTIDLTGTLK